MTLLNPTKATATPHIEDRDIETVARRISSFLHYCVGSLVCADIRECAMCWHAARLGIQTVTPMVAAEMLGRIDRTFGNDCGLPHPGGV